MDTATIVIALATLCGPIVAIQLERILSHLRDKRERKLTVFRTLMATRGNTMSGDHVNALNSVPIEFYGRKPIIDAWEALYSHLHKDGWQAEAWARKKTELLTDLLTAMGKELKYSFNSREIESIYYPTGHFKVDKAQQDTLFGWADVMNGKKALRMEVTNWPQSEEADNEKAPRSPPPSP